MERQEQFAGKQQSTMAQGKGGCTTERQERFRRKAPARLRTSAARGIGHYKTQSKFVGPNHPFTPLSNITNGTAGLAFSGEALKLETEDD